MSFRLNQSLVILGILFWVSPYFLNAQDLNPYNNIIPPNPDAASLAKYVDFPVDLSRGVPQINIPLWNVQCGDINVPVSLSYHAGGIPVAETPSYVGLGWTLNAGGAITRTIRGNADDGMFQYGYGTPTEKSGLLTGYDYTINTNSPQDPTKYKAAAAGVADLEPDMFYFNFCNISGKFVFDYSGNAHLIPRQNILIEKVQHQPPGHKRIINWVITADDGIKYFFDGYEITEQETKTEQFLKNGNNLKVSMISYSLMTSEHHSAWFLTKIEMPNSSKSILFEYEDVTLENTYPVSESYKRVNSYFSSGIEPEATANPLATYAAYASLQRHHGENSYLETRSTSIITGKRLSKIIAPDQTIEFIPGDYRHDLKGDRVLDKILIKNKEGGIIKYFKLSYNYFSENGMTIVGTTANANTDANTSLRLSLESIKEYNKDNNGLPPHTFDYENSVWLPDRLISKAQDHWGYYNGEDGNTSLIPYLNAVRDASGDHIKAGSLVKINYPTGGYTQFNYEGNVINKSNSVQSIGGLRIKEKIDFDPISGRSLFKQYDYHSSGYVEYTPIYNYVTDESGFSGPGISWGASYSNYTSSSNSTLSNGEKGIVSYEKVSVIEGNDEIGINGKTENNFTRLMSFNTSPVSYGTVTFSLFKSTDQFPFGPGVSGAWGTGLLKSQYVYKYRDGVYYKVRGVTNTYKNDYWGATDNYNSDTDVLTAKVGVIGTDSREPDGYGITSAAIQFYFIPSRNVNLVKAIETDYDDNEQPTTSKVTEIEYDNFSPHIYPNKTTHTLSDGNKIVEQILYPQDYTNSGNDFIGLMKTNNIISKPIEKITYKIKDNSTLITGGGIFTYKVGDNLGRLDKVFNLQSEGPISKADFKLSSKTITNALAYDEGTNTSFSLGGIDPRYTSEPEINYDAYDDHGNPTQVTTKDGVTTTFIWAYDHQYPVAKIENATYAAVKAFLEGRYVGYGPAWHALMTGSFLSSQSPSGGVTSHLDDSGYRYYLNLIRDEFPEARVTTYTYKPLVGMTSQTDFNSKTTYYEYDDYGRLKFIKDNDESILKSYKYHYMRP